MTDTINDHSRIDARSHALHCLVAEKLAADPTLLEVARSNVRRWQAKYNEPSPALAEWEDVLSRPLDEIIALLTERSETADRMRQSSPFSGILTEDERRTIHDAYRARTYNSSRQSDSG